MLNKGDDIMIISVDTGNKQFKTKNFTFISGVNESNIKSALTDDVLEFQGIYYTLSDSRIKYTREKFTDEKFFILTLFGIGKEILRAYPNPDPNETRSITLLLGLPLAHYSQYRQFEDFYKKRGVIQFVYQGYPLKIRIDLVMTFVQGHAAIFTDGHEDILKEKKVLLIDIGGFTADCIKLTDNIVKPDESKTLEMGVIPFYNKVIDEVNASFDLLLSENDIDEIVMNDNHLNLDDILFMDIKRIIDATAQSHIAEIIRQLREDKIDLRTYLTVFLGGGSLLLRKYIEQFKEERRTIGRIRFIEDINANCLGYEKSYKDYQKLQKVKKK